MAQRLPFCTSSATAAASTREIPIKLNQRSYPNVRIVMTSICKTLLALMNISHSSWLGIRYNILPSYDLVARNAE